MIQEPASTKNSKATQIIEIITIEINNDFVVLLISVIAPINGAVNNKATLDITRVQLKYSADRTESMFDAQYWL